MVCKFHLDQVVRKAAKTRPKAVAVTFREGGNLNGKPARKRSNIDRTPSRTPALLSSPMAGNRPRLTDTPGGLANPLRQLNNSEQMMLSEPIRRTPALLSPMDGNRPRQTDTPGGLANPPRQLNNSEQMTLSEPIRRRLNLDHHAVCLLCSQPITKDGVTPPSSKTEYHNVCLQGWLLHEAGGPSHRKRHYHCEPIGANRRVYVPVPNGWKLKRQVIICGHGRA